MSKKENLNTAMYDMFGVGKKSTPTQHTEEPAQESPISSVSAHRPLSTVKAPSPKPAVTHLAVGTVMEGTLRSKGDVEISGDFKGLVHADGCVTLHSNMEGNILGRQVILSDCILTGDIDASGEVILNEHAEVNGNIQAESVKCHGKITGNLMVQNNLSLGANARVIGDIDTSSLDMARGAFIQGMLSMQEKNK